MTENRTDKDPVQAFQARALKLVTMFKAVAQLAGDDPYSGREANHEARIVAAQGERMAQELSDDIDQFSIDFSKQKREVEHGEA
jgi:hypothetical protein